MLHLKKKISDIGKRLPAVFTVAALSMCLTMGDSMTAMALEPGAYLVTVKPSYKNPNTGAIDDPGNNEAIGQGMTERMCGSSGLLEVDETGSMNLTVRYYLSQFIKNVSFEEEEGGSYAALSYKEMQTREPVEGATDLEEKYGYTDYRIPIKSMNSVIRGNAYIDAMGRDVVYFFTCSDPVKGSGDFLAASTEKTHIPSEKPQEKVIKSQETIPGLEESLAEEIIPEKEAAIKDYQENGNGSGSENDPVTGIPKKPLPSDAVVTEQRVGELALQTRYDLSKVPLSEARKLVEPMLSKATGITGKIEQGGSTAASVTGKSETSKGNKTVMTVLLTAAFLLLIRFAFSAFHKPGGNV